MSIAAYADNEKYLRNEPISPIPLLIEYDRNKVTLGEKLFFDTRFSKNGQISCASCHKLESGGDDNMTIGISSSAEQHSINTPTIFNARYNFRQHWNGSVRTMEEQIDTVISNHHEFNNNWNNVIVTLSNDKKLLHDFQTAYNDGLTRKNIIDAIVEFEKTLITPNSKFDQHLRSKDNILSKEEIKGYTIFKELGCISCHQGINIGGNLFQKFGVFYDYIAERRGIKKIDYGRMNVTGREMDAFAFKVPTLRNISVTAPYLHDGSAETIEEAIEIMGRTQLGRSLTTNEILLIKSFLNTLTGEYKNKSLDTDS